MLRTSLSPIRRISFGRSRLNLRMLQPDVPPPKAHSTPANPNLTKSLPVRRTMAGIEWGRVMQTVHKWLVPAVALFVVVPFILAFSLSFHA